MRTVVLDRKDVHCGTLLLVNAQYPLVDYAVKSLAPADERFPEILMERSAAGVLQRALNEISAGDEIVPVSGYRSLEEQTEIFDSSLRDNGEEFTRKYVALPNCSEHQTGLAIDLALNKDDIDFIRPDFPYDGICETFRKIAPDHGFIERYAKDKESITGISHEPWHFRYVGYPHSRIISEYNFALEEYIEFLKCYPYDHRLIYPGLPETEIFYIPADDDKTVISIPEKCIFQISGNNMDGFIVTVWRRNDE